MTFGYFGRRNEDRSIFWKDLLLVAVPAAIASIGPVIVGHWLTRNSHKKEENSSKENE